MKQTIRYVCASIFPQTFKTLYKWVDLIQLNELESYSNVSVFCRANHIISVNFYYQRQQSSFEGQLTKIYITFHLFSIFCI